MRLTSSRPVLLGVVCLGAAVAEVGCAGGEIHRGGPGPDGGVSPGSGAAGATDPDLGPGPAIGTGTAGTGVFPGTGAGGTIGSVPGGSTPVGECAPGFNRCFGICMESAAI